MKLFLYFLKKLGAALVTLFLAASLSFFIAHLSGDPTAQILGASATPEAIKEFQHVLGLDRPIMVQYADFVGDISHGDLGNSMLAGESNVSLIAGRIFYSAQLAVLAVALGVLLGVPLGVFAASHEGRWGDRLTSALAVFGQSIPVFWLGLTLALIFSVRLNWLPAGLTGDWKNLVLPVITLSSIPMARIARLTRASMTNALEDLYVTAARARGLKGRRVLYIHALKNASLPVITLIGLQVGTLLSGAITVETVFAWPGLGTLATQAVQTRDLTLVQALVVFGATAFVIINLVVDYLYGIVDPRVRESVKS